MKHKIGSNKHEHQLMRRKVLGLLGVALLAGCDDMFGKEKEKPMMNPEHGKTIEKNGQKYRVFVVGGIRFVAPASHNVVPVDPDGFNINLVWPNIPPGKAPDTKFAESPPDKVGNRTTNAVNVIVRTAPERTGSFASEPAWTSPAYNFRDDTKLGLRLFTTKETPKELIDNGFFHIAYSLDKTVTTPFYHEPLVITGEIISLRYTPNIWVRINMQGWSKINPDWKGIYLGVVETLNQYQEEGKQ